MIKTVHQSNQFDSSKEKYVKEKYLIGIACFQLAAQICEGRSIDSSRLIEHFHELARIDRNLFPITNLTRDQLNQIQIEILTTIDYRFPQYSPHLFISYFLRYLSLFVCLFFCNEK